MQEAYRIIRQDALGQGSSVLVLCAPDVDALCGLWSLLRMLRSDQIRYQVRPVAGYEDLARAARALVHGNPDLRTVVLLNCGGIVDLASFLELDAVPSVAVYVVDSHRPYNLANVREENEQVRILDDSVRVDMSLYPSDDDFGDEDDEDDDDRSGSEEESDGYGSDSDGSSSEYGSEYGSRGGGGGARSDSDGPESTTSGSPSESRGRKRRRGGGGGGGSRRRQRRLGRGDRLEVERARQDRRRRVEEYYRGTYHGSSCSLLVYTLSQQLDKDSVDLLWLGIVGVTDQLLYERTDARSYSRAVDRLAEAARGYGDGTAHPNGSVPRQGRVAGRAPADGGAFDGVENLSEAAVALAGDADNLVRSEADGSIRRDDEFRFMLYRHWNLYESMQFSQYVATRLGVWHEPGRDKLLGFLAKAGIPLHEARQQYRFMGAGHKRDLKKSVTDFARTFGLRDIVFQSFSRRRGKGRVSASDVVYAVSALLEHAPEDDVAAQSGGGGGGAAAAGGGGGAAGGGGGGVGGGGGDAGGAAADAAWERNFWRAYDAISHRSSDLFDEGIRAAVQLQRTVVQQGSGLIEKKAVVSTGLFRYTIMDDAQELAAFSHPLTLSKLAVFLADAYHLGMKKKAPKPFVVAALVQSRDTYIVVGVPLRDGHGTRERNVFGHAFRLAATKSNSRIKHDSFETSVMEIQREYMGRFMELLHSGLIPV